MRIHSREIDLSGMWRVLVELDDGNLLPLKYDKPQTDKVVLAKATLYISKLTAQAKAEEEKVVVSIKTAAGTEVTEFLSAPTETTLKDAVSVSYLKLEAEAIKEVPAEINPIEVVPDVKR